MKIWIVIFIFFFFKMLEVQASATLSGKITESSGEVLIGATIIVKKKTVGTATDVDGRYKLTNLDEGPLILEFSSIGYVKKK